MKTERFVSYIRVSTTRQGTSGLGLEAQQQAITGYLNGGHWALIGEFVEIESGKNNDRPKLLEALALCRRKKATLIIAKLDRLSRNVAFISKLMDSRVEFVAVDFPEANRLTVHILAAVAEHESRMNSIRTKEAMAIAKATRGAIFGTNNLPNGRCENGIAASKLSNQIRANIFHEDMSPIIQGHLTAGMNLSEVARQLNNDGEPTARGQIGKWTPQGVKNLLLRGQQL
jgi:DNA invertase Pin-like site-specific DNA recombinase